MRLIEYEPGRFRIYRPTTPPARSRLSAPMVIRDEMPPTEQVDGKHYTSKARFRAVGRALGLTEVGTEKMKPKRRSSDDRAVKQARRETLHKAVQRYKAGHRPRS